MSYTVKKLAKLSGVSIRTLHYYDEIGLLKPAFISEAGYRYYQEEQLLMLQQILFFRELGFGLKQIKRILKRSDFDKSIALQTHKKILQDKIKRLQELIVTIDTTSKHLNERHAMNKDMFKGFDVDSEQQKLFEKYLEEYFDKYSNTLGSKAMVEFKKHAEEAKKNVKHWAQEDWQKSGKEFDAICLALVNLMEKNFSPDSSEVQQVIERHFRWLSKFWTPNKESYAGHADFIKYSELKNAYNRYNSELADFASNAIKAFARTQLS
jgi:DNA-binding transcriptional MerR regulator